ncbi:helix-turn-helix domain-containing protein [Glycomyces arizonensis]|uniref:helix-turn-helix domain-containing protein n=1 Tax=Glycomyces arizonensis TaxID=256035 RepID=UPI0006881587|nr:helix-turn-helix transcriptional regulator [Glycomyces arizonensis]
MERALTRARQDRRWVGSWSPERIVRRVEHVLAYSRPCGVANLMGRVLRSARGAAERETVAGSVRQAVAESGLTRAEFASRIGTSVSRLSTYATGKVVPSAVLMVRIDRVAVRAARQTES